jgi:IclR family transcriptional regulator, acetate operon repressor
MNPKQRAPADGPLAPLDPELAPRRSSRDITPFDPRSATDRSLAMIDLVLSSDTPLIAKIIGAHLDLPKATVHRLLGSLETKGLIVKDPLSGGYVAGPSLCDMAFKILRKSAASADRYAILANLTAKIGETCNLGILDGSEARYINRIEASNSPLRLDFRPGSRVPLYCSAMGKIFLSQMPERSFQRYLFAADRIPHTPATLVTERALRAGVAEVKESGYAVDDEEYIAGVNCLSVAVPAARAKHLVALAVQAPKSRKDLRNLKEFLPMLKAAAEKIGEIFEKEIAD